MLVLLVISYSQVIAAHPDGGGAYAVVEGQPGTRGRRCWRPLRWWSTTCSRSRSAFAPGAASLGSVFPSLSHHLLLVSLIGLALLTAVNMFGITESAKVLMLPAAVFLVSILRW